MVAALAAPDVRWLVSSALYAAIDRYVTTTVGIIIMNIAISSSSSSERSLLVSFVLL